MKSIIVWFKGLFAGDKIKKTGDSYHSDEFDHLADTMDADILDQLDTMSDSLWTGNHYDVDNGSGSFDRDFYDEADSHERDFYDGISHEQQHGSDLNESGRAYSATSKDRDSASYRDHDQDCPAEHYDEMNS